MMASAREGGADALAVAGRQTQWGSLETGLEAGRLVVGPTSSSFAECGGGDKAALEGVYSWMQQRLKHATPQADEAEDWEAWSDRQHLGVEQQGRIAPTIITLQGQGGKQAGVTTLQEGGKHGAGGGGAVAVLPVAPSASAASSASSLRQGASSVSSASTVSSAPSGEEHARARHRPTRQQPLPLPLPQQQQQQQQQSSRKSEGASGVRAPTAAFSQPGKKMLACFTGDTGASSSVPPSPLPANAAAAAALAAPQQHNVLTRAASDDDSVDIPEPTTQNSMETRAPPSLPSQVTEYGRRQDAAATATALLTRGGMVGGLGHLYTLPGLGVATARQMKARAAAARAAAQARVAALEEEELGLTLLLDDLAHEQEDARFRRALFRLHKGRESAASSAPSSSSPEELAEPLEGAAKGGLRDWTWRRTAGKSSSSGSGGEQRAVDRLPRMIVLSGAPLEHEALAVDQSPGLGSERSSLLGLRGWHGLHVALTGSGADYMVLQGLPGRVHLLVYADFGVVFLLFGVLLCALGGFIISVPTWAPAPAATASFLALGFILRAVILFAHIMMLSMVPSLPAPAPTPAPLPKQLPQAEEAWSPGKEGQEVLTLPAPVVLEELEDGPDMKKGGRGTKEEEDEDEVLQIEVRAAAAAASGVNSAVTTVAAAPALEDVAVAKANAKAALVHRANAAGDPMSGDEWLNALCYAWLDVWVALLCVFNNLQHAMPPTLPIAIWLVARGGWLELMVIFSSSYEERRHHWLPILFSIWPHVVVGSFLLAAMPTTAPWYAALQLGLACVIDGLPLWLASMGFQFNMGSGAARDSTYFFQAAAEAEASGAFWLGTMRLLPILALVLGFAKA